MIFSIFGRIAAQKFEDVHRLQDASIAASVSDVSSLSDEKSNFWTLFLNFLINQKISQDFLKKKASKEKECNIYFQICL